MPVSSEYQADPPLGVIAYSDFYELPDPKVWGDYWFKKNLVREFSRAGYPVDTRSPRALLHLFGEPRPDLPSDTYNILWLHSHPDWATPEVLKKYQKIYCISGRFTEKLKAMGFDADCLMMPTNMTPAARRKEYDIVFVGNTRQNNMRKIIEDLGDSPCRVKIWGWGWKGLIPDEWYGGPYYENARLNELYAASKIVLNDHHDDMQREGFINPRVLDVLASGGFVISDQVPGMNELLGNSVPTYETREDLRILIDKYLRDDAGRENLARRGRQIALRHTYAACCGEIIRHLKSISGTLVL